MPISRASGSRLSSSSAAGSWAMRRVGTPRSCRTSRAPRRRVGSALHTLHSGQGGATTGEDAAEQLYLAVGERREHRLLERLDAVGVLVEQLLSARSEADQLPSPMCGVRAPADELAGVERAQEVGHRLHSDEGVVRALGQTDPVATVQDREGGVLRAVMPAGLSTSSRWLRTASSTCLTVWSIDGGPSWMDGRGRPRRRASESNIVSPSGSVSGAALTDAVAGSRRAARRSGPGSGLRTGRGG